jgi:hypothetical protein
MHFLPGDGMVVLHVVMDSSYITARRVSSLKFWSRISTYQFWPEVYPLLFGHFIYRYSDLVSQSSRAVQLLCLKHVHMIRHMTMC